MPYDFGYDQIDSDGEIPGSSSDRMSLVAKVTKPGYLYVYLRARRSFNEGGRNESPVTQEVYFDDLKIRHVKGVAIQENDYYPFGLTFNSYQRENSIDQNHQYNGKELQDELDLTWYDYGARQYDPAIARFLSVDPAADLMRRIAPYAYAFNNPLRFVDPDGMVPDDRTLTVESTDKEKLHRDVVSETTRTSETTSTRTVKRGDQEFDDLVGNSNITGDNGIGDEIVITTTQHTITTVSTTIDYDAEGNVLSQTPTSSIETFTTTQYSVTGTDGNPSGGFIEKTENLLFENTKLEHSSAANNLIDDAIEYRSGTGKSINTQDRFANLIREGEKVAGTINAASFLWDALTPRSAAGVTGGVFLTGLSVAANMDLARFRQKSDACNNCKKNY